MSSTEYLRKKIAVFTLSRYEKLLSYSISVGFITSADAKHWKSSKNEFTLNLRTPNESFHIEPSEIITDYKSLPTSSELREEAEKFPRRVYYIETNNELLSTLIVRLNALCLYLINESRDTPEDN